MSEPFLAELKIVSFIFAPKGWASCNGQQQAFLAQQHEAQHHHYSKFYPEAERLIVERGDEAIGRLYLSEWERELRIVDIALVPESRGAGIGGAILRDIQDMAATLGKAVSIHVEKNNPARRLYDRLGFEPIEDKGIYDLREWRR